MWTTTSRSEERERPSRPPTGLRHGGSLSGGVGVSARSLSPQPFTSSSSFGSTRSRIYAEHNDEDDNDDSSCDDTYVSMSSSRGRIVRDDVSTSSSRNKRDFSSERKMEPPRVLRETSRATNSKTSMTTRSMSSSPYKQSSGRKKHGNDSPSTAGILDKLKSDINSLEMLRSKSTSEFPEKFPENEFFCTKSSTEQSHSSKNKSPMRSGFDVTDRDWENCSVTSKSFMRSGGNDENELSRSRSSDRFFRDGDQGGKPPASSSTSRKKMSDNASWEDASFSKLSRSRSSDRFFRDADQGEKPPASLSTSCKKMSDIASWEDEKERARERAREKAREETTKNEDLMRRFKALEEEKERLQDMNRAFNEESIKAIEQNERKLGELSDIKVQLEESRKKEAELERALRELVSNVESEQEMMSDELSIAYKLRQSEVALLEEKLKEASKEIAEKADTIQELEDEIRRVHLNLMQDKDETEQQLLDKIDRLESEIQSSERSWIEKVRSLDRELQGTRSACEGLEEMKVKVSEQLCNVESEKNSLRDLLESTRRDGEKAVADLQQLLHEARKENKAFAERLSSAIEEKHTLQKAIDEKKDEVATLGRSLKEALKGVEKLSEVKAENIRLELSLAKADGAKADREREIDTTKAALNRVSDKLSKEESENERLKDANSEKDEANKRLELLLAEANGSKADLKREIDTAKADLKRVSDKLSREESENERLKDANSEKDEAIRRLELLLAEADGSKADLKREIDTTKADLKRVADKLSQEESENEGLKDIISEKEATNKRLETSLAEANGSKADVALELNFAKTSIEASARELARVKEHHSQEIERLEKEMASLEEEKRQQATRMGDLTSALSEANSKHSNTEAALRSSVEKMSESIDSLRAKVKDKDKQLRLMNEATDIMHKTVDELKAEVANTRQKVPAYEAEICKLKASLDESNAKMREKLNEMESTVEMYKTKVPKYEDEISKLRAALNESDMKAMICDQEISSLQAELKHVNERLCSTKKANDTLQESLEDQMSGARKHESKLQGTIESLQLELEKAKRSLEQTNAKMADLQAESKSRGSQLKSAMQSLDEMMKYIESMRKENDDIVSSLEGDLEEAVEMKLNAERAMKKRESESRNALTKQDEEIARLRKELETCRIDALKEVAKLKSGFAKSTEEKEEQYERELENNKASLNERSSEVEALTSELEQLREQSKADRAKLEELEQAKCSIESSLQSALARAELLDSELQKKGINGDKMKAELETSLHEKASESESLRAELTKLRDSASASDRRSESLTQELNELREQIANEGELKQQLESTLRVKSIECEEQMKQLGEKSIESDALRETIKNLESRLDRLAQNSQEEVNCMKSKEAQWSKKIKECEEKLELSLSRHASLAKDKNELAVQLLAKEKENASLKESLEKDGKAANSDLEDVVKKLERKTQSERALRGEVAQNKQVINILQSNEKHLEEHVASLEEQITKLVSDYESRLQASNGD